MKNVNSGLNDLSKNELIDSALLGAVSGGGCEVWVENCGCKMVPGEGSCCDWCGQWVPKIVPVASIT
jgi:hypothetical protein